MYVNQSIRRPQGINAFGSCLVKVDPDYVSVRFAVTRIAAHPKDAFAQARGAAQDVRERLRTLGVDDGDVRGSEVTLEEAWSSGGSERKKLGYEGRVVFHLVLRELAKLEPLLSGVVDAGVDRIMSVHPKTTLLKEIRADARARAVRSARAKAEELASAAGAKVGAVLHIEDVNADDYTRRSSHMPDVDLAMHDESIAGPRAENPGSITVAAAVMACFAIVA